MLPVRRVASVACAQLPQDGRKDLTASLLKTTSKELVGCLTYWASRLGKGCRFASHSFALIGRYGHLGVRAYVLCICQILQLNAKMVAKIDPLVAVLRMCHCFAHRLKLWQASHGRSNKASAQALNTRKNPREGISTGVDDAPYRAATARKCMI